MKTDVAVIGAGPAGLSAALYLAHRGCKVMVLDEYFKAGGRLLGQLYENNKKPPGERLWNGGEKARRLTSEATTAGAKIVNGATVWNVTAERRVFVTGSVCGEINARALLLATGAAEKAVPVEGWTLPGVMSVGAAQVFTNVHRVKPGERVAVVGIDPLSISVAGELKKAGVEVVGIFLPPPGILTGGLGEPPEVIGSLSRSACMSPNVWLKAAAGIFGGRYREMGARICSLATVNVWGIPVNLRRAVLRVEGDGVVQSVVTSHVSRQGVPEREDLPIAVDAVCISGGLYPVTELASLAGCRMAVIPELGGRIPLYGPAMQTTVQGVFVAGNITGIEGAPVALAQGTLAAAGIAAYLGKSGDKPEIEISMAMERLKQVRQEVPMQFLVDAARGRRKMADLWASRDEHTKIAGEGMNWTTG